MYIQSVSNAFREYDCVASPAVKQVRPLCDSVSSVSLCNPFARKRRASRCITLSVALSLKLTSLYYSVEIETSCRDRSWHAPTRPVTCCRDSTPTTMTSNKRRIDDTQGTTQFSCCAKDWCFSRSLQTLWIPTSLSKGLENDRCPCDETALSGNSNILTKRIHLRCGEAFRKKGTREGYSEIVDVFYNSVNPHFYIQRIGNDLSSAVRLN